MLMFGSTTLAPHPHLGRPWWGQADFCFKEGDCLETLSVVVAYGDGAKRAQYVGQPNCDKDSKLPAPTVLRKPPQEGPLALRRPFTCAPNAHDVYG